MVEHNILTLEKDKYSLHPDFISHITQAYGIKFNEDGSITYRKNKYVRVFP